MSKVIKEIVIMLFVCLFAILALAVGLYNFVPSKKVLPEITTYVSTEDVKDLLEDDIDTREEKNSPVLTYEITSSELKSYQKSNEYVPGKINPFEAYVPTVSEEEIENGTQTEGEENTDGDKKHSEDSTIEKPKDTNTINNEIKTNIQSSSTK